jgi:hypothetical protein
MSARDISIDVRENEVRPRYYVVLAIVIAAFAAIAAMYVARAKRQREEAAVDVPIVAEIEKLVVAALAALPDDDSFVRQCGRFQSWKPESPGGYHRWRAPMEPRLSFGGTAKFEKADVNVAVMIVAGPKNVTLGHVPGDDWLSEHAEIRARIINRRLTFSELFMDEPDPPGKPPASDDVVTGFRSESYGSIEARATHPAFVP